ncbi:MAG: hypothetical protein GY864_07200 [Desulfobacterales bacterium]|nr:hypothetical protein [Desulfobacterales bacterium]
MNAIDSSPPETFWQNDSFSLIKPDEFKTLGIDPGDIPIGTFAALKHPSYLPSRFGGNAYGFGLFEIHDRLKPKDLKRLHSVSFDNRRSIRENYRDINEIYKKIGLLVRFSSLGYPYYLIPAQLLSGTLRNIRSKVEEISKIVAYHRKKYYQEYHDIGLLTHQDDLITNELSLRFTEHNFVVLDSLKKLQAQTQTLDLVILTRDLYEIVLMEKFTPFSQEMPSKKRLDQYAAYILWKIYSLLKSDGEIFIIANHYTPRTNQTTKLIFKSTQEKKRFFVFNHIFKTKRKYTTKDRPLKVNVFDFQKFISGLYVEQELVDKLLDGKTLDDMTLEQIDALPHINFPLSDIPFMSDQEKNWSRLLSIYFDKIILKPLLPQTVEDEWKKRFTCPDYAPNYMISYLGEKKKLETTIPQLLRDVTESRLVGCPPALLADYRNSFEYVIQTLRVLEQLKKADYEGPPDIYLDRLKQPLENRHRRFAALNDIIKLISKVGRLENIKDSLNPDRIEGSKTKVLENLEALAFFGFNQRELREIIYIVLGHTPLGRVISGKMNEKSLKPISDMARTYDQGQGLNLLRYCRLMTLAEVETARGRELSREQLLELFDLYESIVRVVTSRDLDWDELLDEKINFMGGIHNKIIRKLLKMLNHFEFIDNWPELGQKGKMEKESLADYDDEKVSRIENVIRLVNTIERFEELYLKSDPLQLPAFYRKFLNIEFHGTGHIFERMDSELVFKILWITVNLARGEIINLNPVLADVEGTEIDARVMKVEQEARIINIRYIDLAILKRFSKQLYQNRTSFILGTGFLIRIDPETQALELSYMDMDKNILQLEFLSKEISMKPISAIPIRDLKILEMLFSDLESFYQSHIRLLDQKRKDLSLPSRQIRWFKKVEALRQALNSNLRSVLFQPENIYTDLDRLHKHAPSILNFILPELTSLKDLDLSWSLYLDSPIINYIITAAGKLQALIRHDKDNFQDAHLLHKVAQREFGPMAAGIVGVNEAQISGLEKIIEGLRRNKPLFNALIKSFIFQDLGRVPELREKFKGRINPADHADAGAFFIEKGDISTKYHLDHKEKEYLIFLVRHHSLFHHIIRGEVSFAALRLILDSKDKDLFEAVFLASFIMLSSFKEDFILEDPASQLFEIRAICNMIIAGKATYDAFLDEFFLKRGNLFYALQRYETQGLPKDVSPSIYLKSDKYKDPEISRCMESGKMIAGLERIFRLRGIKHVEFVDLANYILNVPLKFVYKERRFSSVGYASFEKEILEASRIYKNLQQLEEKTRHFILNQLADDKVRIYGYEKVSSYVSYENQIKLLLVGLLGATKFKSNGSPIHLNFLGLSGIIDKRYEAVNDYLNQLSMNRLLEKTYQLNHFFKAKTGFLLKKEKFPNVCSIDFRDRIDISRKISYITGIKNVAQLRTYYHHGLMALRKHPFNTDDYELDLEKAFEKRHTEITDMILDQTDGQMNLINDFKELHSLVEGLFDRALDIGLSADQKHRLNDLYELRKDNLKRKKLNEIDDMLQKISDIHKLEDYWDSIKWYLQTGRRFFGKEFESLISKKFDRIRAGITAQ